MRAIPSLSALRDLRRTVAEIGRDHFIETGDRSLRFGLDPVDDVLGGGLAFGALHELAPSAPVHMGATTGFALALAAGAGSSTNKQILWIHSAFASSESGHLYGPGFETFGLACEHFVILQVSRAIDALWAMEEALKCRAVASVITELTGDGRAADLTATRRLALAAREGGGLGLLLRHQTSAVPSTASTRWAVASAPSTPDRFGGFGPLSFDLSLLRNRRGPRGRWMLSWDQHEHAFTFPTLPRAVAAADSDGSHRTWPLARTG
ncbi:MAG TPA: DNA repair protein [Xanthobacteraceae bacterium]|nr:DNA repair protein [Xanthobacteraceae bacterium]